MDLGFQGLIEDGAGNGPGPVAGRKTAFLDPFLATAFVADAVALKILTAQVLHGMGGQQVVAARARLRGWLRRPGGLLRWRCPPGFCRPDQ